MNNVPIGSSPFVPSVPLRSPYAPSTPAASTTGPVDSLERAPAFAPAAAVPRFPAASPAAGGIGLLRRTALAVTLGLSLLAAATPALAQAANPVSISEQMESEIIGGRNQPGKLVEIFAGNPEKGTTFTVHGINRQPVDDRHGQPARRGRGRQRAHLRLRRSAPRTRRHQP